MGAAAHPDKFRPLEMHELAAWPVRSLKAISLDMSRP
jgi:hypothetical protein